MVDHNTTVNDVRSDALASGGVVGVVHVSRCGRECVSTRDARKAP